MTGSSQTAIQWQCLAFDDLDNHQLYQVLKLRQAVFIVEQNCIYNDLDDLDQPAWHILAHRDGELLATLRCIPPGLSYPEASMGRIAVSNEARGLKLGRQIVERGIRCCQEQWPGSGIRIGAQNYLEKFYQDFGFVTASDVYDEDGIPHIKMLLESPRGEVSR